MNCIDALTIGWFTYGVNTNTHMLNGSQPVYGLVDMSRMYMFALVYRSVW